MKLFLMLLMIVSMTLPGFAQREFGSKTLAIPHFESNLKTGASGALSKFNVPPIDFPALKRLPIRLDLFPSSMKKIGELPTRSPMIQKEEFKNPGDIIVQKLNKRDGEEVQTIYRKNQYLGDYKTKSAFIKVFCRDYGLIDGDEVRLYVNDVLVVTRISLDDASQEFDIPLTKGFNKIEFEAINQGLLGPNTAEFQAYDDKEIPICANQWNLATGFRATMIIVKE
ncbi:hypothetical protein [Flavobacterium sp. GT3R68]|uniref:hypothetical protein n=1 Tax=Flavobacterium sp. GT3R68 TaxID=2594437 RepID=UPI000F89CA8D|nr:hypothetical protein [Flavobacterium sp. GT3R68]RTY91849.1 hypothetical protein EKL32_18465 [Flavobacterium sp. GSN2]TRW90189.1 hypothetical protein FNW07_12075 [Flavobacterium sp. GT3R68]